MSETETIYFNREISWLRFNERVLELSRDNRIPLLERLKFLGIFSANLDEFFMVRVASLIRRIELDDTRADISGLTPLEQLTSVLEKTKKLLTKSGRHYRDILLPLLNREKIYFHKYEELTEEQKVFAQNFFQERVFPVTMPMACDMGHPFPALQGNQLYFAVQSRLKKEKLFSIIPVPEKALPRLILLPSENGESRFVFLEELVREFIDQFYLGNEILECSLFRLNRDAEFSLEEMDAEDLRQLVESQLKERRKGAVVRLETEKNISASLLNRLLKDLEADKKIVFKTNSVIDYSFLLSLYDFLKREDLKYPVFLPKKPLWFKDKLFREIARGDKAMYHPYHSIDPVVELIEQAAEDSGVLAIKMVLYRVGKNSPIIKALRKAAENGKQVSVLLELYARFDEQNNMENARLLEESGAHVVYGVVGLKTHAKALLIIRKEPGGIRRYAHLSTGNYNVRTARFYSDFGVMTAREDIADDVSHLFNVITGYSRPVRWRKLGVAPINLKQKILDLIENEIQKSRKEIPGQIFAKMNSLLDTDIINALYRASRNHVRVNLVVRGICALKPGVAGLSENISVRSIVGRYLEHARIFRFNNGNDPLYFYSSADWMPRNLIKRIEAFIPVEDDEIKDFIDKIIELNLSDNVNSWVLKPDGNYKKIKPGPSDDKIDMFHELSGIVK